MARHASPVPDIWGCSGNIVNETVRAFGVYSVNALFTSYHEIIAHNANIHIMRRRARRASPLQSLAEARLNTKQTNIIFAQIQRNNVIAI